LSGAASGGTLGAETGSRKGAKANAAGLSRAAFPLRYSYAEAQALGSLLVQSRLGELGQGLIGGDGVRLDPLDSLIVMAAKRVCGVGAPLAVDRPRSARNLALVVAISPCYSHGIITFRLKTRPIGVVPSSQCRRIVEGNVNAPAINDFTLGS